MSSPQKKSKMLEDAFSKALKPATTIDMTKSQEFHLADEKEAHKWRASDIAKYVAAALELPQYAQVFESHGITGVKFITFASEDELIYGLGMIPSGANIFHFKKMFSHVVKLRTKVLSHHAEKLPTKFTTWGTGHIAGWLEYILKCPTCVNALLLSKLTGKEISQVVTVEDMEILLQGSNSEEFQKALDALGRYCYKPPDATGADRDAVDDLLGSLERKEQAEAQASLDNQAVLKTVIVEDEAAAADAGAGAGTKRKKGKKGKRGKPLGSDGGSGKKETAIGRRLRLEKEKEEEEEATLRAKEAALARAAVPVPTVGRINASPVAHDLDGGENKEKVGAPPLRKSITFNPTNLESTVPAAVGDSERDGPHRSILKHAASDSESAAEAGSRAGQPKKLTKRTGKGERVRDARADPAAAAAAAAANSAALNAQLAVEALKHQIAQERQQFQGQLAEMERLVAAQKQSVQRLTAEANRKDATLLEATKLFEHTRSETSRQQRVQEEAVGRAVKELANEARADRAAVMNLLATAVDLNATSVAAAEAAAKAASAGGGVQAAPQVVVTALQQAPAARSVPADAVPTGSRAAAAAPRDATRKVATPARGNSGTAPPVPSAPLVIPQMAPLMPELGEEPAAPEAAPQQPTLSASPITLPAAPLDPAGSGAGTVTFAPETWAGPPAAAPAVLHGVSSVDRLPQTPQPPTPSGAQTPTSPVGVSVSNSAAKLREITSAATMGAAPRGQGGTRYRAAAHPIMHAIAAYEQAHPGEAGGAHGSYSGDLSGVLVECGRELAGWTRLLEKYKNSKAVKLTNSISDYQLLRVSSLWTELGLAVIDDHLCDPQPDPGPVVGALPEEAYLSKARAVIFNCAARLTAQLDIPTPPPAADKSTGAHRVRDSASSSLWATGDGASTVDSHSTSGSGSRFVLTATELKPLPPPGTRADTAAATVLLGLPDGGASDGGGLRVSKSAVAVAVVFLLGIVRKVLAKHADLDAMQLMHLVRQMDPGAGQLRHQHGASHGASLHKTGGGGKYLPSATVSCSGVYKEDPPATLQLPVQELGREDLRHLIEQTLNVNYKGWEQFDSICQKIDVQSKGFVTLEQVVLSFVGIHPLSATLASPGSGLGLEPRADLSVPERVFHCCKVASVPLHCVLYVFSLLTAYTAIPAGADGADVKAENARKVEREKAVAVARAAAAGSTGETSEQQPASNLSAKPTVAKPTGPSYASNQAHVTALLLELMMSNSARVPSFRRYLNKAAKDAAAAAAAKAAKERAAAAEAAVSSSVASLTNSTASLPPAAAAAVAAADSPRREVRIVYTNYSEEDEGYIENVALVGDLMHLMLSEFLHDDRASASSIQSYCAYLLSLAKKGSRKGHGHSSASSTPTPAVPTDSLFVSSLIYLLQPDQLHNTCHAVAKELQIYYYGRPGSDEEVHPLQSFVMLLLTFTSFGEACHGINAAAEAVTPVGGGAAERSSGARPAPVLSPAAAVASAAEYEYMLATLLGFPVPVCYRHGHAHTPPIDLHTPVHRDNTTFPLVLTPIQVTINRHLNASVPAYIAAYNAARGHHGGTGRSTSPVRERDGALIETVDAARSPAGSPERRKGKPVPGMGVIQGVNDLMQLQRVQQISSYLEICTADAMKKKKLLRFVLSLLAAIQKQTAVGADRGSSIGELTSAAGLGTVPGQSTAEMVEMARRVQEALIGELKEEALARSHGGGADTKLQLLAARIDSYRTAYAKGLIRETTESPAAGGVKEQVPGLDTRELFSQLHDHHAGQFRIGDALQEIVTVKESVRVASEDIIRVVDTILQLAAGPGGKH